MSTEPTDQAVSFNDSVNELRRLSVDGRHEFDMNVSLTLNKSYSQCSSSKKRKPKRKQTEVKSLV